MQQDLMGFMKPADNKKSLMDYVVTPYNQKFNRKEKDGFSLFDIIENESLLKRFSRYTFPEFQKMDNGNIFMQPTKKVIQTLHEYYIKWMVLDNNFTPSHDHDYPYANVPKSGYLIKIVIPNLHDNPLDNTFTIEYACDINNIVTRSFDSINNIDRTNQNSINVDMKEDLEIEPFDPAMYPKIYELVLNIKEFFKLYLSDVIE